MGVMQLLVYMGPSFAQLATPWGPSFRTRGPSPSLWRRRRCLRRCESGSGCSRGRPGAAERARAAGEAAAPAPFAPRPQGWAAGKRSADRQRPGPGRRKDERSEASGPLTAASPIGPGPQPVPSPAGSPGQHHGRHPGSPSPPGRGLLDSQATSRFTQGLLHLRVQASCPAGCSGPSP